MATTTVIDLFGGKMYMMTNDDVQLEQQSAGGGDHSKRQCLPLILHR
jgi:hypothetical protein